jgi:hypothetical protein
MIAQNSASPWNTIPKPRPADWGFGMTVCIAAVCDGGLIGVSDRMISMSGYFSGDRMARKVDWMGGNWMSMLAGDDISQAIPIYETVGQLNPEKNLNSIVAASKTTYKKQRIQIIEDSILPQYGLETMAEYKTIGKQVLAEDSQYELALRIKQCSIGCEFLISGFDDEGDSHIFTLRNPGTCEFYNKLGFWAIGSGQQQAISSLFASKYSRYDPIEYAISKILGAKFTAESATGVGKSTFTFLWKSDFDDLHWLDEDLEESIRKEWAAMPKYPTKVIEKIRTEFSNKVNPPAKQPLVSQMSVGQK